MKGVVSMNKLTFFFAIAGASLGLGLASSAATAGPLTRAWVSNSGVNVPPCGAVSAPCHSFQYAHDIALGATGGEIDILDPGDYGPIKITKPLSILNDSAGTAGVLATPAGQDAIQIVAGTGAVFLKGLTLLGGGTANNGIDLISAGNLNVSDCTITGFGAQTSGNGNGIAVHPSSGTVSFSISDTIVTESSGSGIFVFPSSATVSGTLTRVEASGNEYGVTMTPNPPATATVIADQVTARGNYLGFYTNVGGFIYLTRSTATGNQVGVLGASKFYTYGDNSINGNGVDVQNPMTLVQLQ
jgi:hypothetical protein